MLCVFICLCVYVFLCIFVFVCVMHALMCMCINMCFVYTCGYVCTCMFVCTCVLCTRVSVCARVCAHGGGGGRGGGDVGEWTENLNNSDNNVDFEVGEESLPSSSISGYPRMNPTWCLYWSPGHVTSISDFTELCQKLEIDHMVSTFPWRFVE